MAITEEAIGFVRDGLTRGIPRGDLERALLEAGWKGTEARAALESFADAGVALPVPRPRPNLSARDAFLYLVLFTTLYVVAFNLGSLLFDLINMWIPDPASGERAGRYATSIRWSASALIVSTPVFLFMSTFTSRERRAEPVTRTSKVRRWLTYMTLFIAATVLIGDVTMLVYTALGGELTTRFVLKSLVVAAIAGTGFTYYLSGLRADEHETGGPA